MSDKRDDYVFSTLPCREDRFPKGWVWKPRHSILAIAALLVVLLWAMFSPLWSASRYPVGQPVPASVYTEPFDPCDPAYKFIQTNFGEPNKPKWQAAPDDWILKFGNNERTMLIHSISELRVVVAQQTKRLMVLEAIHKDELTPKDPNEEAKP